MLVGSRLAAAASLRTASSWRCVTGKVTYIGSWLTIVASVPLCGPTKLPTAKLLRPIRPAIGALISV